MTEDYNNKEDLDFEVFHKYFKGGILEEISSQTARTIAKKLNTSPDDGDRVFLISHVNEEKTVIVVTENDFGTKVYFNDLDEGGNLQGSGDYAYQSAYKKSTVNNTNTKISYAKGGLGTRRLYEMNAFSMFYNGVPIRSGTFTNDIPTRSWQSLVDKKHAKDISSGNATSYTDKEFIFNTKWPEGTPAEYDFPSAADE